MRPSPRQRSLVAVMIASLGLSAVGVVASPWLPRLVPGPVPVQAREIGVELTGTVEVSLPFAASDVSVHWLGAPNAVVSLQLAMTAGQFGEVIPVNADEVGLGGGGRDEDLGTTDPETYSDVIWTAGARFVRLTADRPLGHVTVVAYQSDGPARMVAAEEGPVAEAAVDAPPIVTRAGWGADERYRFDWAGNERFPPSYFPLQTFIVHHTAGRNNDPNPAATIRAIYYDDAIIRHWGDMGYNFLIDSAGRIYEGRHARTYAAGELHDEEDLAGSVVRGAHAKGFNAGTLGIVLLGTFDTVQPTAAARASLEKLLAWEASRHGINPTTASTYTNPESGTKLFLNHISGHRNVNVTDCPGALFYPTFPALRTAVANRIAAATGSSVDHTPPTVASFTTLATTPTGGSTIDFGLRFNEPVAGLSTSSFGVAGTSSGWTVASVTGVGAGYKVSVMATSPPEGTVVLDLPAGSVVDGGGNAGPATPASASATFAVDTTAPTVALTFTPKATAVNAAAATFFDVTITFSEPVSGLTPADIVLGGTANVVSHWAVDEVVGSGAHYSVSVKNAAPASGTLTVMIPAAATADPAGNLNAASAVHAVLIDTLAPKTFTPSLRLRSGIVLGTTVAATLAWGSTDGSSGSGIATFDVARSVDGAAFATLKTGLTSPTVAVALTPGHAYRFEVRAYDHVGNVGAWAPGPTVRGTLLQQSSSSIGYHGTWTTVSSSSYSGGSLRYATAYGASASLTTSARGLAFVTSRGPNRGSARIYLDGVLAATVNLNAASYQYRYVAYAVAWSSVGTHTIRVILLGTADHPRVDLDAFEILR